MDETHMAFHYFCIVFIVFKTKEELPYQLHVIQDVFFFYLNLPRCCNIWYYFKPTLFYYSHIGISSSLLTYPSRFHSPSSHTVWREGDSED